MKKNNPDKTFLPQYDGRALDFIKVTAAIFMVTDHINAIWFGYNVFPMLLAGRGAFPLFCYAVAVAVMKMENDEARIGRYVMKLLLLAVLVQPFYQMALEVRTGNVVFTLAGGAAFAVLGLRARPLLMYILYAFAALSALLPPALEFGLPGILLPSAFLLAMRGERGATPFLALLFLSINANGLLESLTQFGMKDSLFILFTGGVAGIVCALMTLDLAKNISQKKRWLPKYALHVFYPAHLALLKILALAFS